MISIDGSGNVMDHYKAMRSVVLIGFQEQANLGLGYLASTLRTRGYPVIVCDFEQDADEIAQQVEDANPILVGFSLIFQFYLPRFRSLASLLRRRGVESHFTIGGHFPSLSYSETLRLLPEIDSVVRFEGELTLVELIDTLVRGADWRKTPGLAFRLDGAPTLTESRPLVADLDSLPYPDRSAARKTAVLGRPVLTLLASRGCIRTCSFCSIHTFYRSARGKVVRTRRPAHVVREMEHLFETEGARVFLFQDDDFPLFGPVWQRWAREFLNELHSSGLARRVIWKINCRADVVERELFAAMRDAGLYLVYMGLESGTEEGLDALHKEVSVEQNLRAVECLKDLNLMFDFGFMLFDPSSTFTSVHANIDFLRRIVGDGSGGAVFCRMIPYDGTPIKDQLEREGRLRGDVCTPDYDFLDPRLNECYLALKSLVDVTGWIHGHGALSHQLNWIWNETGVLERLFPPLAGIEAYKADLRAVTRNANELLFAVVEGVAREYEGGERPRFTPELLRPEVDRFLTQLVSTRNEFIMRHQDVMLDVLECDRATPLAHGFPPATLAARKGIQLRA